jgi:hypothetical protein
VSPTRASARALGLLVALVAAWGGIVAYAGPSFHFYMGNTAAWSWTQSRATLHFAPAIAGILGGLLLLIGRRRSMQQLGSLLGITAGIWFVIGPSLEPLWTSSSGGMGGSMAMGGMHMQSKTMQALEAVGYHYGTGAVLATLAALALGLLVAAPAVVAAGEPMPVQRERLRSRPRLRTQQ